MARSAGRGRALSIKGLKEADKALKKLPGAIRKKVLRQALRKAARPLRAAVKANAPVDSGDLRAAVKVKAGKRSRTSVSVVVRIGEGDFRGDQYYAAFQEFGWHDAKTGLLMPGKHYMERAFDEAGPGARDDAAREIVAGAERAAAELGKGR